MDRTVKGVIAVVLSLGIVAIAVYGSFFPLRKAQMFIGTLQSFQSQPPSSLNDLENRIAQPLDYPSPIGQEELVRNTANSMLGLLQRGIGTTSTVQLVNFLDSYYDPIITSGKGMSFGQDIYLDGAVHEIAFGQTGNPILLQMAQSLFERGRELGPNRPQVLYGLFDVYRTEGNASGTVAVANQIMANWPTDQNVPAALAQFLNRMKTLQASPRAGK